MRLIVVVLLSAFSLLTTGCSKKPALAPDSTARSTQPKAGSTQPTLAQSNFAAPSMTASGIISRFASFTGQPSAKSSRQPMRSAGREIRGRGARTGEYALFVPDHWNGDLALYAHGYIPAAAPVGIASVEALGEHVAEMRDLLLDRGFAVGYASYSANGFNVKEGAVATDRLREIFSSRVGDPERTFLIAQSLGAIDAVMLAESDPGQYAGLLSVAGALGGSQAAIDYYGHIRVLFDLFYPGVLPGSLLELPPNLNLLNDVIIPAATAIAAHPEGAFAISQITQTPVPFRSGEELGASIVGALVFHAIALDDLLQRTHGHSLFGNRETVYSSSTLSADVLAYVNSAVARYSIAPDAGTYLRRYYRTTGRLETPTLTLHMRWDPLVPLFHEAIYRDRVAARGRLDLLEQRTIDKYGHPGAPPIGEEILAPEIAAAFDDLVARTAGHEDESAVPPIESVR